ncbi:MAG: hypothetical protein RLZZ127_589 [Planctomycetota bacterium]
MYDHTLHLTGNQIVDEQHRQLLSDLKSLAEAAGGGTAKASVGYWIDKFRDHCFGHFQDEEAVMAKAGYPDLAKHREAHKALTAAFSDLLETQMRGEIVVLPSVLSVANRLLAHFHMEDATMAAWCREHGIAEA